MRYPDGTVFLHVEMLVDTQDNYCPEECLLETAFMSPQGQVMGDDATVSPAILGYSSADNSQRRSAKRSCHHEDEGSVASGNRSVSAMSTDASVAAASAFQQHQTAMLQQQQQQMQMQQMQQQAAQQIAYQAPMFQYPPVMMPSLQHQMPMHSPRQQANGAAAAAAAATTQAGTSLQAAVMAGNAGAEIVSPASQNPNSAISPHVQHHAESVIRNLDQAIEDAKKPPE
jgi:hypothetical protein